MVIDIEGSAGTNEFVLNYAHVNIFAGEGAGSSATLEIREMDCADNAATNDQPGLDNSLDFSSSNSTVTADINVDLATIATSPYWSQEATNATQGKILFFAWLLVVDSTGTGVIFDVVKVAAGLDLTGDFSAATGYSYSIGRDAATGGTPPPPASTGRELRRWNRCCVECCLSGGHGHGRRSPPHVKMHEREMEKLAFRSCGRRTDHETAALIGQKGPWRFILTYCLATTGTVHGHNITIHIKVNGKQASAVIERKVESNLNKKQCST